MSNIDELQRRITSAMDRVARGVERISAAPGGPDEATLQALEEERVVTAQLSERVRALRQRSESELAGLRAQVEETQARMIQLDVELQRLRRANRQLGENCAALQAANAEGVGDPELINQAMQAELEGLRAARAVDVAESSAILAALRPLVEDARRGGSAATEENA
jgi:chromosome segregation ATPase